MPRSPLHAVDRHVGARVRRLRRRNGASQADLAAELGITMQQMQKYESGANRVSASKLFTLSQILRVPIGWFFEGLPPPETGGVGPLKVSVTNEVFLATHEGPELAHLLARAPKRQRRALIKLIAAITDGETS